MMYPLACFPNTKGKYTLARIQNQMGYFSSIHLPDAPDIDLSRFLYTELSLMTGLLTYVININYILTVIFEENKFLFIDVKDDLYIDLCLP